MELYIIPDAPIAPTGPAGSPISPSCLQSPLQSTVVIQRLVCCFIASHQRPFTLRQLYQHLHRGVCLRSLQQVLDDLSAPSSPSAHGRLLTVKTFRQIRIYYPHQAAPYTAKLYRHRAASEEREEAAASADGAGGGGLLLVERLV